jgi:hypothetical protein
MHSYLLLRNLSLCTIQTNQQERRTYKEPDPGLFQTIELLYSKQTWLHVDGQCALKKNWQFGHFKFWQFEYFCFAGLFNQGSNFNDFSLKTGILHSFLYQFVYVCMNE